METLIVITLAVGLPILASRGALYRGLWFALGTIAFVALSVLYGGDLTPSEIQKQNLVPAVVQMMNQMQSALNGFLIGGTFGCLLAGMTFRAKGRTSPAALAEISH